MRKLFVIPNQRLNFLSCLLLLTGIVLIVPGSVVGTTILAWPGLVLLVLGLRRFFEPRDLAEKSGIQIMGYGFKMGLLFGAAIALREAVAGHSVAWAVPLIPITIVLAAAWLIRRPKDGRRTAS